MTLTGNELDIQTTAKMVGIGSKKLFKLLRELKVLNNRNMPYQKYIDDGILKVEARGFEHPVVGTKLYARTFVTPAGVNWIKNKLEQETCQQ